MRIFANSDTSIVEDFIKHTLYQEDRKALHIVPTMILYRKRLLFYQTLFKIKVDYNQLENHVREKVALYDLNAFLKEKVYQNSQSVLSQSESTVIIERLLKENELTNNEAWLSVITDINKSFNKWESGALDYQHLASAGTTPQWNIVLNLYQNYKTYTNSHNLMNYGEACYQYILSMKLDDYSELIIDGAFLPVRPELHLLMERFKQQGKNVTILLPVNKDDHQYSYNVVKDVYSNYLPLQQWEQIPGITRNQFYTQKLKDCLFAKQPVPPLRLDRSIGIYKFDTVEEELEWIVKQIAQLIKSQHARKDEIVIITPNAMNMRPVFRELFELYNITTNIPKKSLSRLKEGRGIAHLYKIFADPEEGQTLYITPAIFEEILYSHLFAIHDDLITTYRNIKVFFLDCINFDDWEHIINQILEIKANLNAKAYTKYHPLSYVNEITLEDFKNFILLIKHSTLTLMSMPTQTIRLHLRALIKMLSETTFIHLEESLKSRLIKVLNTVNHQERIPLTSAEFGLRIMGLLIENEEGEDDSIPPVYVAEDYLRKGVLVTTPNTIEYAQYKYVFLCRFTQDLYPCSKQFDWLDNESVEQLLYGTSTKMRFNTEKDVQKFYADLNLYYVHTAINTCSQKLIISYATRYDGAELYHSHYLHDFIEPLGINPSALQDGLEQYLLKFNVIHEQTSDAPVALEATECATCIESTPLKLHKTEYTIEDLTVYKYCPRRFYYTSVYPQNRVYSQEFQLQLYVTACMYESTVIQIIKKEHLAQPQTIYFKDNLLYNKLLQSIDDYIKKQELDFKKIFLFSDRTWKTIYLHVKRNIEDLLKVLFKKNPYISVLIKMNKNSGECSIDYNKKDIKAVEINGGVITTKRDLILTINGHEQSYNLTNFQEFLLFTAHQTTDQEQLFMTEIKEWYYKEKYNVLKSTVSKEIATTYESILHQKFNKNPGCHCHYCPFVELCRER